MGTVLLIILACVLLFCGFGIYMSVHTSSDFSSECERGGNHVVMLAKGNMLCVSPDGRIVSSR
jgi:hypothetical protein